jgi:hypothetical protein
MTSSFLGSHRRATATSRHASGAPGLMLELLGLSHMKFQIIPNKSQRFIYVWWNATFYSHIASEGGIKST